jgi:RNA polymerase sigma-54 factor
MKQSLQLRLSQHLTLTPQLQQSIRLLQLSTQELDQEIERYLRDNPLLERSDGGGDPGANMTVPRDSAAAGGDAPEAADAAADGGAEVASSERGDQDMLMEMNYGGGSERDDGDDADYPQVASDTPTLREHLLEQLALLNLSERLPVC